MKITFLGATHEVTGSSTLIEVGNSRILIDCGLEQGGDTFENRDLPVSANQIDCVILTHAHIDHSGKLPMLFKNGCRAAVYATEATCDLCRIMLADSAHIQESEAEWRNRKAKRAGTEPYEPLYTMADAQETISRLRGCVYGERIQISENVFLRFTDVGHLLGSAAVELWLTEGDEQRKIVFSGDVGNIDQPFINDPQPIKEADYVVMESTYGDRYHERPAPVVEILAEHIQRTLDRGGNVIIPSFAVGRTQEMLYFIREIKQNGMVTGHDGFPVYVDSPLANAATGIFLQCSRDCLDAQTRALVEVGQNPLVFPGLKVSQTSDESKAINFDKEPKVIISASGMCEAGRIRHHLKHNLWNEKSLVLFVGYQAVGSLGRSLVDGAKKVKLFGEEITVKAQIAQLQGKSGHADKAGLLSWLSHFEPKPKMVFVNHGDDEVCESFVSCLNDEKGYKAFAPHSGTEFDLKRGLFISAPEGVPVEKKDKDGAKPKKAAFNRLMDRVSKLEALARGLESGTNKDAARLADQISAILDKWN